MNDRHTTPPMTTMTHVEVPEAKIGLARNTPGPGLADTGNSLDMARMRAYRLNRLREQLVRHDYAGCVLFDPINIRYATGSRNMAVWTLHNAARYCFVPTEGPVVLFDYHNCQHLSQWLESIDEIRPAIGWFFFAAGPELSERAERWATEIADLVVEHGGGNRRLAIDHCNPEGAIALTERGIQVFDAQAPMEYARCIKSDDEVACMNVAISVCETGMARIRDAVTPGVTENQLWALLNQANAEMGGEWIETRLLSSGGRTNPWFQEATDRVVRAGELVCFDTDLIGPFGYCADISRAYFCEPGRPSREQQELYRLAHEQIHHNMALLEPGLGFRELAEKAWVIPGRYRANRYSSVVHGVGLCDEYPRSSHADDAQRSGYDGVYAAGMTVCVESYMGAIGGYDGVKLEQQVLITDQGVELLSTFPFEEVLLGREV